MSGPFDHAVLIIGTGLIGASLAQAFAKNGVGSGLVGRRQESLGRTYLAMKKCDLVKQEFQKTLELSHTTSKGETYKKEAQAELDALKKKGK